MKSIEMLKNEHDEILTRMDAFDKYVHNEDFSLDQASHFIQFIKEYVDSYHHNKEEKVLFPWMLEKNPGMEQGPIGVMLREHDLGRELVKKAENSIAKLRENSQDATATEELRQSVSEFVALLSQHIYKENNILYQFAESMNQSSGDGDEVMLPKMDDINRSESSNIKNVLEKLDPVGTL